jgi:hypothetical protein
LGEHTSEVLGALVGLSGETLKGLQHLGIIGGDK